MSTKFYICKKEDYNLYLELDNVKNNLIKQFFSDDEYKTVVSERLYSESLYDCFFDNYCHKISHRSCGWKAKFYPNELIGSLDELKSNADTDKYNVFDEYFKDYTIKEFMEEMKRHNSEELNFRINTTILGELIE